MKSDRMHVIFPDGEMIAIGRKFYVKIAAGWRVQSAPPGGGQFDAVLDFRKFLKEMGAKLSGVRITGQVFDGKMIDGVETVAYEFTVSDASETGIVQVIVGKNDGYIRHMYLSGGAFDLKMWFTNINERLSIEPPI